MSGKIFFISSVSSYFLLLLLPHLEEITFDWQKYLDYLGHPFVVLEGQGYKRCFLTFRGIWGSQLSYEEESFMETWKEIVEECISYIRFG
jgi:hypothetical protein